MPDMNFTLHDVHDRQFLTVCVWERGWGSVLNRIYEHFLKGSRSELGPADEHQEKIKADSINYDWLIVV